MMKRTAQAVQTDIPDKRKPVKYSPSDDQEESDENSGGPSSTLTNSNTTSRLPGTVGKQPVSSAATSTVTASGKPPRPATAGKQPNTPKPLGTGGKQPDLSPQKYAEMKRNNANPSKSQSSTTGKGPAANTATSSRPTTESQSQSVRSGTGGKEPHRTDHNQTRYQPSSLLAQGSKAQSSMKARPQTQRKQHPLIGKSVKVFYVPEGYFTGVVKSHLGDSEFNISWDDGSLAPATLKEEDETEASDNEDRWSVLEEYETQTGRGHPEKSGVNGAKTQKKLVTTNKPTPPPPPQQRPAAYEDDDEENDEPDNDDNEPDDNDI